MTETKRPRLSRDLEFEKKNQDMLKLPKHARVQKRPIPHPAIASPYAGSSVPKTVYVSTKSPFMSVVKRVRNLLRHAEKRATRSVDMVNGKKSEQQKFADLARGQEELQREEVFVKASGRAIEKVIAVGKWFEEKEEGYVIKVKTGSVLVVDDIVETEKSKLEGEEKSPEGGLKEGEREECAAQPDLSKSAAKRRKRAARAMAAVDGGELPETRTRWVNTVEVAVSLK